MEPRELALTLDLQVLAHLRGFPEELERYANLVKHAHPRGRSACALIIHRPGPRGFLRRLCQLVAAGVPVVTTWEAAALLGVEPPQLLEMVARGQLPPPEFQEGWRIIWRRQAVEGWKGGTAAGDVRE